MHGCGVIHAQCSGHSLMIVTMLQTQALTCFGGQVLGDFIAQAATTGGFAAVGFDWHRSIVLSSFAALIGGVCTLA